MLVFMKGCALPTKQATLLSSAIKQDMLINNAAVKGFIVSAATAEFNVTKSNRIPALMSSGNKQAIISG